MSLFYVLSSWKASSLQSKVFSKDLVFQDRRVEMKRFRSWLVLNNLPTA